MYNLLYSDHDDDIQADPNDQIRWAETQKQL